MFALEVDLGMGFGDLKVEGKEMEGVFGPESRAVQVEARRPPLRPRRFLPRLLP